MRIRAWEAVCAFFLGAAMTNAICIWFTGTVLAHAQDIVASSWVGVWQGELDGVPSVVLTLAQDSGTLEGTLVLNIITRENGGPHVIAHEAHVLLRTRTQGGSLTFQVKRIDASANPMEFTVNQTTADSAKIHCLNCGDHAPTVAITKID
ncbi:MAG TPA: hypothetical protein VGI45_20670 [Terracidiphilus sp.]|jgi:hypothetical protein